MNGIDRIVTPVAPVRTDALGGVTGGRAALNTDAGVGGGQQLQKQLHQQLNTALTQGTPSQGDGRTARGAGAAAYDAQATAASRAVLSADARTLDALLRLPGEAPVIDADRPLCPVSPSAARAALPDDPHAQVVAGTQFTALLARALVTTLESSGLFYESHLAQWATGQRDRTLLDGEPQARFQAQASTPGGAQADTPPSLLATLRAPLADTLSALSAFTGLDLDGSADPTGGTAKGSGDAAIANVPEALQRLVRQQLELLQTPLLRWHGEAWPGTSMAWEIEQSERRNSDGGDGGAGQDADGGNWRMQLRLDLPALGAVDVELQLQDARLSAKLKASPHSAATLLHASEALRRRIQAAGIELKTLSVREFAVRGGT
ncbi:flagellar hook-length control protein FliK [Chitinasiproducens palmae]|uniref:Hook-length control protein FliK n=1 Tax=Chitinasiproducens palmae TaxID=1770053 RepID=A0A1H2PJL0_9BURK|nr:flagellar hook-length control protein FliK [Chitinasiproducens palmae]SDV46578.1 hook-length control protein FliK [Chitinasiproducens palmae]